MTRVRAGRANGLASPSVTGLGSRRAWPSSRCAAYPPDARGARPVAMARTALSRAARMAGASAAAPVSPSMARGTARSTQSGTASAPTPYTCAVWPSSGTDSRLPVTTPATTPARAGTATWIRYAATTCPGEKPMDFSTPIRRVPAATAPLTTLPTISTDITSPSSPKATMNGTHGAIEPVASSLTVR